MNWFTHFNHLKSDWGMGNREISLISGVPVSRLEEIGDTPDPELPNELSALRPLLSIRAELSRIYPSVDDQTAWLGRANEAFDGKTPAEILRLGEREIAWMAYVLSSIRSFKESSRTDDEASNEQPRSV